MAITPKQAIAAAHAHLLELFPQAGDTVRLEEVERDGSDWAITFSMAAGSNFAVSAFGMGRVAKVIVVDGETSEFLSLKQRVA